VVSAPTISSFTVHDDTGDTSIGKGGASLTFEVVFSEAVTVNGTAEITFMIGGARLRQFINPEAVPARCTLRVQRRAA